MDLFAEKEKKKEAKKAAVVPKQHNIVNIVSFMYLYVPDKYLLLHSSSSINFLFNGYFVVEIGLEIRTQELSNCPIRVEPNSVFRIDKELHHFTKLNHSLYRRRNAFGLSNIEHVSITAIGENENNTHHIDFIL